MSRLALEGGVAKATLYNHFRTKGDVLGALVDSRVAALGQACAEVAGRDGLTAALEHAASALSQDEPLRAVRTVEPGVVLPLLAPGPGRGWDHARAAVQQVLSAAGVPAGSPAVEAVLRWLVGQVLGPASSAQARFEAAVLASGLPTAGAGPAARTGATVPTTTTTTTATTAPVPADGGAVGRRPGGLGWPPSSTR